MENGPFIDDFPIKTSIYKGFSMAMLNNQMVGKLWKININHLRFWANYPTFQSLMLSPLYNKKRATDGDRICCAVLGWRSPPSLQHCNSS